MLTVVILGVEVAADGHEGQCFVDADRVEDGHPVCHSVEDNIRRYYKRSVVRVGDGHPVCHSV